MNILTEIRKETAFDVNGKPYEKTVWGNKKKNLGELWESFKKIQAESEAEKIKHNVYDPKQYCRVKSKLTGSELQAEVISQNLNQVYE